MRTVWSLIFRPPDVPVCLKFLWPLRRPWLKMGSTMRKLQQLGYIANLSMICLAFAKFEHMNVDLKIPCCSTYDNIWQHMTTYDNSTAARTCLLVEPLGGFHSGCQNLMDKHESYKDLNDNNEKRIEKGFSWTRLKQVESRSFSCLRRLRFVE